MRDRMIGDIDQVVGKYSKCDSYVLYIYWLVSELQGEVMLLYIDVKSKRYDQRNFVRVMFR